MTRLNWPNRLTIARIILILPFVICLLNLNTGWAGWRYVAMALFGFMALSDAADGFLARFLNESTALGRFLDPVGDKLLVTCAVILFSIDATSVHGFPLPSWVPAIAIGKDLLTVIGFLLVYAVTGQFLLQPRILGKSCTVVQLAMVAFGLLAPNLPTAVQGLWPAFWWISSTLAVVALLDYVRLGSRFAAEHHAEPPR